MNSIKIIVLLVLLFTNLFSKQEISVQLLWKHQFEFAGYYVAKELGFYAEKDLNVEIKEITPHITVNEEVRRGRATFGIGRTSLLLDIEKGDDFVLLASIFQYSPSILLTLKSSGIKTPQDLKGKRVMIASGSEYDAEFFTAFRHIGLDFLKDTKILQHSTDIYDLINNKTDAMYAYISNEPFYLRDIGIEYNILNPKNYGFDFYGDMLFTTQRVIDNDPNMVKDFKEATLRGYKWAFENIDQTVDLIYNKYNSQNKSKQALLYEAYELKKMAYYETDEVGVITKTKLKRMVDLYYENNLLKNPLNLDNIVFEYNQQELYLTKEEKEYLQKKQVLKVHNELNYKPFSFYTSGKPSGYSIDLMDLIAKKLDIQVEYISGPSWSEFLDKLKNNTIDVMLNITPTSQRLKHFNFTIPYKKYNYIIYSNSHSKISSLDDLKGKNIALVKDFAIYEYIKQNYPEININEEDNMYEVIRSVGFGKSDATITTEPIAQNVIVENSIYNVVPTGSLILSNEEISQVNLSIATNKENIILNNILQKALQSLSYDELFGLDQKWFVRYQTNDEKLSFSSNEISYLQDKQVINMCIDPDWMPYESIKNSKHIGLTKDFMDIFEAKIGIPIKLIPTNDWDESMTFAKERKCDIFSLAMPTEERLKYMNFTTSYISSPLVIATKNDKLFVADINDVINSEKIGIVKGYAFEEIYKKRYPNNKLVSVNNIKEGLDLVAKGELYGFIDSLITIGYQIKTNYISELKIAGKFDDSWELGIGVRNDDLTLHNIFQKVVLSLDEGVKQNIISKWISVVYEERVDYTNLFRVIAITFVIIVILAYRQYILSRYNKTLQIANQNINEAYLELRYLIDTTMEAIFIVQNGKCIDCNYSAIKLLGFENKENILNKDILDFISTSSLESVLDKLTQSKVEPYEIKLISKTQEEIPVLIKCQNFKSNNKEIRIVAAFDLREIKEQNQKLQVAYLEISKKQEELHILNQILESRVKEEVEANLLKDKILQHQARLAQMGELISIIAHQWRQPLACIATCAIGIRLKLDLKKYDFSSQEGRDDFVQYLYSQIDDMEKYTQNLTQTIDDFKDFYKPKQKYNLININEVVLKALDIIEVSITKSGTKIIKELNSIEPIRMHQNEMMQVVLNILKNSYDNFKEKNISNSVIKITSNDKMNGVELIISDNGLGIEEENISKVFDPYYTTKNDQKGTGLGLYIAKAIVQEHHNGTIRAENTQDGISFIIFLNKS
ncbi:ABC transporter substrate-binding protein [Arcobacter sp. FWKO B]|uniref:ABC transporter substrate-binding protein n=1 Tax=Arcobacter sp. FWKO B TaxID=2593672 RepID=UPI0018A67D11|nr:transporter substrate-binding domain-containing protein [Arcobacter sp. FWKO B]QOG11487.1 transporter substrate-binding domain-containing protein [Arcobacter sp. FWKO B]